MQDGKTGYYFKTRDSSSLYNVLEKIVKSNNINYTSLIENIADFNSSKFDEEKILNKYIAFFDLI